MILPDYKVNFAAYGIALIDTRSLLIRFKHWIALTIEVLAV